MFIGSASCFETSGKGHYYPENRDWFQHRWCHIKDYCKVSANCRWWRHSHWCQRQRLLQPDQARHLPI